MVGGGGVRLAAESSVTKAEFFVAFDARGDERSKSREALVRIAGAIEPQWLEEMFPNQLRRETATVFDAERGRVVGRAAVWYRDLLLREDKNVAVDREMESSALADALQPMARELFLADEEAANVLRRIALLREHLNEHPWPSYDDEQLGQILGDAAVGKRSIDEVRRLPLASLLKAQLQYPLDRLLEEHAPESIAVPTGNRIRLKYADGQPPVLAVRLQEIFGWTETPRIAAGRLPVTVNVLGPNYRPVQITNDLKSFWATTYFQVRKDLRVRYPKHAWPEDPLTAKPQAKGRSHR